MHLIQPELHSRRAFLRRSAQLAATGAAYPLAMNLSLMSDVAAQSAGDDYKALVCVFLLGGNDHYNTIVSYDPASHAEYQRIRTSIAIARDQLAATALNATAAGGQQYAMHPSMVGLSGLFNSGKAAVLLNAGPLIKPTTKEMYRSSNRTANPLPPKLFSHNDQQSIWQSSRPEGSTVGWGGNLGDYMLGGNGANSLFTCISVTGNAVFLSGDQAISYQVGSGGPVRIWSVGKSDTESSYAMGFRDVGFAVRRLALDGNRTNQLEKAYNAVTIRAVSSADRITAAVDATKANSSGVFPTPYDKFVSRDGNFRNPLADQMRMVARLIGSRSSLGVKRQVFMVSLGGFDLHDNLVNNQPDLMRRVSEAMTAFHNTTVELGVADKVTAFTASDFGRTLSNNGDGSDHGWGSHNIIVGGAVKGGALYGYAPPLGNGSLSSTSAQDLWQVGQGRLLPTTSVDQYAATLAKWFGVPDAELPSILPNLSNFGAGSLTVDGQTFNYPKTLDFMTV